MILSASALVYGDDISTDLIIAGKYTKTLNVGDLAAHAMEDADPEFRAKAAAGAFLVAGTYFGCGSSREQAPTALQAAGVRCVVAKSFARIFYRNAINIGLPLVECDTSTILEGHRLAYEPGSDTLLNESTGERLPVRPLPAIMVDILLAGGIVPYMLRHKGFRRG